MAIRRHFAAKRRRQIILIVPILALIALLAMSDGKEILLGIPSVIIVEAFYEAGNRGDLDSCFNLIADEITWTNIGSTPLSGAFQGKKELMEKLPCPLFGQLRAGISSSIERLIGEGDYVVALTSGAAETLDGRPHNNRYCQIIRIRDGQFVKVTEYFDADLAKSAFGWAENTAQQGAVTGAGGAKALDLQGFNNVI